jgi:hypothetical protein
MNHDGFLDRPKGTQINAAYLLNYNDFENQDSDLILELILSEMKEQQDKLVSIKNWLRTNSRLWCWN